MGYLITVCSTALSQLCFHLYNAEIFFKPWRLKGFFNELYPLHLNSYVMGLRPFSAETDLRIWQMKWNESGSRPPLCTYRLNWARRTSWEWWDDWEDTVLQTQDSKFEPWRSEADNATSRSRRLPTILSFTRGWGRNIFVSFKPPRSETEPRTPAWKAAVLT